LLDGLKVHDSTIFNYSSLCAQPSVDPEQTPSS
jgi:hypothetical protein